MSDIQEYEFSTPKRKIKYRARGGRVIAVEFPLCVRDFVEYYKGEYTLEEILESVRLEYEGYDS